MFNIPIMNKTNLTRE